MNEPAAEITPPAKVQIEEGPRGRGVHAVEDIEEGETIEVCPTVTIASPEAGTPLADYVLQPNEGDPDDAVLLLGYGSLYNHSFDPNAEYIQAADNAISFSALRPIEAGEEITIDYGDEWWDDRGLEPD